MLTRSASLRPRLDSAVAEHPLLEHPFYRAWAEGTLTVDDLAFYSTQYWRQVEAFPGYLEGVVERLPEGRARDIVAANLSDERDDDHPRLWLDFANGLGVADDDARSASIEAETQRCVDSFSEATTTRSLPFALGMLYGYESQTPEVATTKVAGLRDHYGIEGSTTEYFVLHGELDVEHSAELMEAIETVTDGAAAEDDAVAGARAGAQAINTLLDGVARVRSIDC